MDLNHWNFDDGGTVLATSGSRRVDSAAPRTSLLDLIKVAVRLGPKQVNDEIQLAIGQMKGKGVAAGVAAALIVVGLVFLSFLVVALIVAAVAALSLIFQLWAAALIVAGAFLLIAVIFALIGLLKLKSAMPLMPEDAIRGLRLDLGVAREGTGFDPQSLDRADAERARKKKEAQQAQSGKSKEAGKGQPAKPDYTELLRRTALRRDHLASLQDQITQRASRESLSDEVQSTAREVRRRATSGQSSGSGSGSGSGGSADAHGPAGQNPVAARWKPLAVFAGSAAAGAVFLRELVKK